MLYWPVVIIFSMCTVGSVEQCIKVHAFDALSGYLAFHPILAEVGEKKLKSF